MDTSDSTALALRVALQTMKERNYNLQRRNNVLEQENQQLRNAMGNNVNDLRSNNLDNTDENEGRSHLQLKMQLTELQRQNLQLNENINMVSQENRKLWSRLSQMAKEQQINYEKEKDFTQINLDKTDSNIINATTNANLIRSKTFTKHSPNPQLRPKITSSNDLQTSLQMQVLSLEDGALNECEVETGPDSSELTKGANSKSDSTKHDLGFAYFNMEESVEISPTLNDSDFNVETKKCLEGLQDIRYEALKQRQSVRNVLSLLQQKLGKSGECAECAKRGKKPEMADKSLETDESLNDCFNLKNTTLLFDKDAQVDNGYAADSINNELATNTTITDSNQTRETTTVPNSTRINFIQEKIDADKMMKTCPVCGRVYNENVKFENFLEHVETHFVGDTSDLGSSLNFEFVSHTVGDF